MIKKLKLLFASVLAMSMIGAPALVPATVYAADEIQSGLCQGANLEVGSTQPCGANDTETQNKVNDTIEWVINVFSIVVGIAAVIMIIIGGLRYIISGGDSGNVTSAKNTILYAIIGLVVVALAQFVVKFVLGKVSGATAS